MDKRKHNGKSHRCRLAQKARLKIPASKINEIRQTYENGATLADIGKHYHTTAATVLKYFRDNGIVTRTKSEIMKDRMTCPKRRQLLRDKSIAAYLNRRKFATGPELHFEEWLKTRNIRYVSQYRKVGNKHPYDFFLKDHNLIVEIDGHYWHSKRKQKRKDIKHTKDAINKGYFIVRIDTFELKKSSYENLLGDYIDFATDV